MYNLVMFTNDKYRLLKFLYDNQIQVKKDKYIPLSQQEIADMLHISKMKANGIIKELKLNDCIGVYKSIKGKYIITKKGLEIINIIEEKLENE
ncbi:cyclic nucleotide-binding domain-containing protein [Caviibacter abscessus]|uniref:MarR family transcriptional regulator n=1 Tax=Caviibacter abscessus TaxID=1766719 RepID=UPI0008358FE0|nr:MarR family transcriptional regulator [Caviibacter abscessus]